MASYDFSAPRLYIDSDLAAGLAIALDKDQQNYLGNVLRLSEGDAVLVFNGRDGEWRTQIQSAGRRMLVLNALARVRPQTAAGDLHYMFAPLKHARLDYMVQKAVEMGATCLRPIITRRTQAARLNEARMRANAIEAAEQCGILALPEVRKPEPLEAVVRAWPDDRTLVFCDEDAEGGYCPERMLGGAMGPFSVLVGPEGGFDPRERELLLGLPRVVRLNLGPRILRADTAAVAALTLVQALAGDWRRS